jgi:hypothetical protein
MHLMNINLTNEPDLKIEKGRSHRPIRSISYGSSGLWNDRRLEKEPPLEIF